MVSSSMLQDQTLKMGNLAATDYKITLDATDGSAMFSSGNVAISNGTNGEGKLEIYRTGAAADNSDVRDAFVMGVATNNMRGVLQTDGSLYLSDSHISNVDNAKTKIKGDGSAEFSNLVQIERDDTTVGGLASVFSFTGKVNGDLASRLVYKAGGALELRDEDNNANIELISNGNAKLQRGITQAFTLVNSIYDRPVFSLQDLEEHATVYPPSQGSGLHFNGNWVGLNGADGYGVSSEIVFGRSVPCLPRGWSGKIQLTAFAASNYGTAIRIETSDNNGLNWDIRAESSSAIEEETLVYERDSSNPVPTNTWVRIRMVAAAGTATPAVYCRWSGLVITNLPEFNTLFKGRDLLDFDGNLEVPGGKLTVTKESVPMIKLDDGGEYQAYMQLAGNDLEIRGSNGDMEFFTGVQDGQSSYERMRIKSNGNVGPRHELIHWLRLLPLTTLESSRWGTPARPLPTKNQAYPSDCVLLPKRNMTWLAVNWSARQQRMAIRIDSPGNRRDWLGQSDSKIASWRIRYWHSLWDPCCPGSG